MPILRAFDLETTSADPATARIWQVATDEREWIVNPGVPIPDEIKVLCHIDEEMEARIAAAPSWSDVEEEVLEHLRDCDALVTQNGIKFDLPVLASHLHAGARAGGLPPVIDVRMLAFEAWPDIGPHQVGELELTGHKLVNVAMHLGLVTAEEVQACAHDARWDCRLALRVCERLPEKWTAGLERLLAFQGGAMALQDSDWQRYGVVPDDGPKFLWFRTCRKCQGRGNTPVTNVCPDCNGKGFVHHTQKRRGQPVDNGYIRFVRGLDTCPAALRRT